MIALRQIIHQAKKKAHQNGGFVSSLRGTQEGIPVPGGRLEFVSFVGRDESTIREYIRNQEKEDQRIDQMNLWK